MITVSISPQQRNRSRYRAAGWAAALCVVIAVTIVIVVVAVTQPLESVATGPFLIFAALWAWAGYRLRRYDRGALAVGLAAFSVAVLIANTAVVLFILSPLSAGGTVQYNASSLLQLLVPSVGAIGVLLGLRRHRR